MDASQKIPATVITGFLGAGKTTVIRYLLKNAGGRRIALIINEFGDVGVDAELIKGCGEPLCREDDIVELANGCICCTVADDFLPAMARLLEREAPPQHIVVETSGLALPQPLVRAFNWPEISARISVDGVIAVVDSAAVAEGRFADDEAAVAAQRAADPALEHENPLSELFEDQLACADMILLNKADLVEEAALAGIEEDLRGAVRAGVHFVRAREGVVDPAIAFGLGAAAEADLNARNSHHEMNGEGEHDHDDFDSFSVAFGPVGDRTDLLGRIAEAIRAHDILRVKGFVAVNGAPARLVVQAVGPRISAYFDRPWRPDEPRASSLVVIGEQGLDRAAITRDLQS
ncbi:MAG: cobalamin biosynthesis protein CobW [Hyphomicrobiales bacterium]|nr:cobalamin biosynthesis protein CobW [Hyphomicrobiales bacterium]